MNDTKFLALCVLLSAVLISGTIIWSTKASEDALARLQPGSPAAAPASGGPSVATVTIQGPVTLAPFAAPIPVTVSTSEDKPLDVKNVPDRKWTR